MSAMDAAEFPAPKDKRLSEDDVVAHCRKELTGYKIPKIVRFVDALPKSTVGKILRRELRDVA